MGFTKLTNGLDKMQQHSTHNILTITVSPAIASKWLLNKMDIFQSLYPKINIHLNITTKSINFISQNIDISIHYGLGYWHGLTTEKLMNEELFPVYSPDFLKYHPLSSPIELLQQTSIHDLSMDLRASFPGWKDWFKNIGIKGKFIDKNTQINNSTMVIQPAINT